MSEGPKLSSNSFRRIKHYLYDQVGIVLTDAKLKMVEGRLQKRLRALSMNSFDHYCQYALDRPDTSESVELINALTTNKTDFFREKHHFDYIEQQILPTLSDEKSNIRFWSAGCSTGEEPYSMSIMMLEWQQKHANCTFDIYATDISTDALATAKRAIYSELEVAPIPLALRQKYLLRGKTDPNKIKVAPIATHPVTFERLNLTDNHLNIPHKFDIIFCRNVLIYFDRDTQAKILRQFARALTPNGHLMIGHSETLNGIDIDIDLVGATTYKKR